MLRRGQVNVAGGDYAANIHYNYMNTGSEDRMIEMLKRAGIDPEIAILGETEAAIKEIRRRCQSCENEDLCDRWLAGKVVKGGTSFCPNAKTFRNLMRKTR